MDQFGQLHMSPNALTSRLPWQDRWTQPTLLQLLDPLKIQHRRLFEQLMADLTEFEQVDQVIHWYGFAWNWTIQYRLHDKHADQPHTLLYLVPRVENPIIVIPLSDKVIEQLPLKRLNRFIRDGIKNAKHAVAIHWATWTPNSKAEVSFLTDLLKRKCKLLLGVNEKAAPEAEVEVKPGKSAGKVASAKAESKATAEKSAMSIAGAAPKTDKGGKAAKSAPAEAGTPGKTASSAAQPKAEKAAASTKPVPAGKKPVVKAGKPAAAAKPAAKAAPVKPAAKTQVKGKSASKPASAAGKGKAKTGAKAVPQAVSKAAGKSAPAKPAMKPASKPKAAAKPAGKASAKSKGKLATTGRKK